MLCVALFPTSHVHVYMCVQVVGMLHDLLVVPLVSTLVIPYSGKFSNGANFRIFGILSQYIMKRKRKKLNMRNFKSRVTFDLRMQLRC